MKRTATSPTRTGRGGWEARLKEPPLTEKAIAHSRHWKPGKIKSAVPETQREIERNLQLRCGERILSHVLPHAARFQAMKSLALAGTSKRR